MTKQVEVGDVWVADKRRHKIYISHTNNARSYIIFEDGSCTSIKNKELLEDYTFLRKSKTYIKQMFEVRE